MKKLYVMFALVVALSAGGCLCGQSDSHYMNQVSEGVMEYRSEVHDGYSFRFNSTLVFNEESSYDNSLITMLIFEDSATGGMIFVGVLPSFMSQGWMEEACDRDKLVTQLKSQRDLNVTEVKSIVNKDFKNLKSCIAEVTAVEQGIEVPLAVSFAECKSRLPIYAVSGGPNYLGDMKLLLESFDC